MIREIRAAVDPTWVTVLSQPFPLRYSRGGSSEENYPAFARAASAIRRWQGQRVCVQDDVNARAGSHRDGRLEASAGGRATLELRRR